MFVMRFDFLFLLSIPLAGKYAERGHLNLVLIDTGLGPILLSYSIMDISQDKKRIRSLGLSRSLVKTPRDAHRERFIGWDGLPDFVRRLTGCQTRLKMCINVREHKLSFLDPDCEAGSVQEMQFQGSPSVKAGDAHRRSKINLDDGRIGVSAAQISKDYAASNKNQSANDN
jgi:hypothetical protein